MKYLEYINTDNYREVYMKGNGCLGCWRWRDYSMQVIEDLQALELAQNTCQ